METKKRAEVIKILAGAAIIYKIEQDSPGVHKITGAIGKDPFAVIRLSESDITKSAMSRGWAEHKHNIISSRLVKMLYNEAVKQRKLHIDNQLIHTNQ